MKNSLTIEKVAQDSKNLAYAQDRCMYRTIFKRGEGRINLSLVYGPHQANLIPIAYASSEGSGEPVHPRSLARTFAARS